MTTDHDSPGDDLGSYAPPQDTGAPDAVETDPAALNSAEDLDEDRLRLDPLEAGMDPPEHWTAADKYGTTPYEQAHARPLDDRLAEEQPDVSADRPAEARSPETRSEPELPAGLGDEVRTEAVERGQSADEAGGSVAEAERTPESAD
ncbi:hypothetical protein [Saccharothrix obliqua]|uniref:hypothetical protein n=1 Tax=Saccharothrix obliqua TaxID=2861747 RepID=UPI001C5FD9E2|nr:hypothetical protein [Saccharothrix obliqua]MBW4720421.1 hypothetical protein [Saccharothrix obliqua]